MEDDRRWKKSSLPGFILWPALLLIACGIVLRLYHITADSFYFYDTGMYLNYGRILFEPYVGGAGHVTGFMELVRHWMTFAIQTDRPLWQFIVDARTLWGGLETWWYIRAVSAAAGLATLGVVYMFAVRFYGSRITALASAALLAVLPGHIFYSRTGLPEALTTFFFMLGFYFYVFPRKLGPRTFWAGLFFALACFTNYRFFILPVVVGGAELFQAFVEKRAPDVKKWACQAAVFAVMVAAACLINGGSYFYVTSNWILHQVDLARIHADWFNLFSYPYMLFRLETPLFAVLFFANVYFVVKKKWAVVLPFFMALLEMGIFTGSSDKAARYIAVVQPFMAMSVAALLIGLAEDYGSRMIRTVVGVVAGVMVLMLVVKAADLPQSASAYSAVMEYINTVDPGAGIATTQPLLLNLFAEDRHRVIPCPGIDDLSFLKLPQAGFRYLVIGPQAYVSWTKDQVNFSGELGGAVGFFDRLVPAEKTFAHMNRAMIERFVFEHNQSLRGSIDYLNTAGDYIGTVRVYNIPKGLELMRKLQEKRASMRGTGAL